jgi:hypothetical protein
VRDDVEEIGQDWLISEEMKELWELYPICKQRRRAFFQTEGQGNETTKMIKKRDLNSKEVESRLLEFLGRIRRRGGGGRGRGAF